MKLSGGVERSRIDQNQGSDIPWHMIAAFRNLFIRKRVELQRPNEMQRQPQPAHGERR